MRVNLLVKSVVNIESITVEECKEMLENDENIVLLDVRTPHENDMSKIHNSNALLIPLNELQARISELDKDKKILIYCATGSRSQIACSILQSMGFENCFDVRGGIYAWQRAGFEVEKGKNFNPFTSMFNF